MVFLGKQGPGCFTIAQVATLWNKGVIIQMPDGSRLPGKNNAGIVVVGVDTAESEAVGRVTCFKDKIYTYAFGMRPGHVRVRMVCFFGSSRSISNADDQNIGDSFKELLQSYNTNRISKSLKPVKVYIPGRKFVLQGDLDAIQTQTKDPNSGMQDVILQITTTEPQGRL